MIIFSNPRDNFGLEVVGGNLYAVGGSVIIGSEVGSDGVMTLALMMKTLL